MYTLVVVDPDRAVDLGHELPECLVPAWITEVDLPLVVEGLLVAVLPWTTWC